MGKVRPKQCHTLGQISWRPLFKETILTIEDFFCTVKFESTYSYGRMRFPFPQNYNHELVKEFCV